MPPATVFHPGGGEYANVASNWLRYTFKNDKKAGKKTALLLVAGAEGDMLFVALPIE